MAFFSSLSTFTSPTTAAFLRRSRVDRSASVCAAGAQAPLTAQIIGGWYGHRCHIYSDCEINQLPPRLHIDQQELYYHHHHYYYYSIASARHRPTWRLTLDIVKVAKVELLETAGLVYRSALSLSFVGTCPLTIPDTAHTAPSGWIFFLLLLLLTSPANRPRLFLCAT